MGYNNPKWSSGYIIRKESNSAPLYWHNDWWAWDDPISFAKEPPMIFVMFYLTNTNKTNGCLRVIPGSHLNKNAKILDLGCGTGYLFLRFLRRGFDDPESSKHCSLLPEISCQLNNA